MAGSLASSRATPTRASPPTPPPRKTTPHMRHTMRKPPAKSDDEDPRTRSRHRKKALGKLGQGHKHYHHEGSRKRWREEITARERKRYEGLWASNRGYLLTGPEAGSTVPAGVDAEQLVVNVVVRDIWIRSRLPLDELGEVWDVVDRQGRGYLDKTEFVVGMWLIDQRLRGRKIPQKVSPSVWGSAQGMQVLGPKSKKEKKEKKKREKKLHVSHMHV
ncbi:Uu.00g082350.m01.CDS01 [Anthostomella pinea]|uniref:Uu.00g082350.m01.CDS01 n=1 Tax=Anthostomella pinea TaxID=933095 RepID=A0AAI8YH38_9PEZI|nr:Uu.00g082350.m01.CDS01 [Anthostomella pinea]